MGRRQYTRRWIVLLPEKPTESRPTADSSQCLFAIVEYMAERGYLGEFELMVMLALLRLGDDAYGVPISKELAETTGRGATLGSVYAALERLERKELVSSKLADPTPERGGRAKRYFVVTRKGLQAVQVTKTALEQLWRKLPALRGQTT